MLLVTAAGTEGFTSGCTEAYDYICRSFDGLISKEDVDAMAANVDRFSLMTYDFSNPSR